MRKVLLSITSLAGLAICGAAHAGVSVSSTPGSAVYAGTPTYDFDTATPVTSGGGIVSGSLSGNWAQPLGSTGNYFSVGPSTSSVGTIFFDNLTGINWIDFIWGSIDEYNVMHVLRGDGSLMHTITGGSMPPADGNWTSVGSNKIVRISFTGQDAFDFGRLELRSTSNAFEVDNFRVNAVPEPGTWALLILGFGAIGYSLRRHAAQVRRAKATLRFV